MAFAFVQSVSNLNASWTFAGAPTAGNLVVSGYRWEGATGSSDVVSSQSGGGTFTMLTRIDNGGGDHHAQIGYLLGVTATNSFALTFPGSSTFFEACHAEFSSSDAATFDTSTTGSGSTGTALASGSFTLASSAANWLAVGWGSSYSGPQTYSARVINGVAAAGSQDGSGQPNSVYGTLFWRLLSTAFTGTAAVTANVSDAWICNAVAFKAGTGAGPSIRWSYATYPKAKLRYADRVNA